MQILSCPFCEYTDVEICEVEPGRFAIECPECERIGPFADSVDDAAVESAPVRDIHAELTLAAFHREVAK